MASTPSVGALLFEIRQQNRLGTAYKFRYAQTPDPTKKMMFVKNWKETQQKKIILKLVCKSYFQRDEKKRLEEKEEKEMMERKRKEEEERKEKERKEKEKTLAIPTAPTIPEWLVRSAIKSSLQQRQQQQQQQIQPPHQVCIPEPPPLPIWLLPKKPSGPLPTSPPRPKGGRIFENSAVLKSAKKLLRTVSYEEGLLEQRRRQQEQLREQQQQQQRQCVRPGTRALEFVSS